MKEKVEGKVRKEQRESERGRESDQSETAREREVESSELGKENMAMRYCDTKRVHAHIYIYL